MLTKNFKALHLVPAAAFLLLLAASPSHAQGLRWAKKAAGSGAVQSNAVGIDAAGNTYITGAFQGTATFGSNEPNQTILTSAGNQDIFIAKYNSLGALQWAKQAGGPNIDSANGIVVDASGNSYIAGSFETTATFVPGQTVLTSAGFQDIFVAKYDSSGALVWAKRAGGTASDVALAITQDGSGNSYVTGRFAGSATFGPGELKETILTSAGPGSADIFVAQFASDGSLLRVRQDGGSATDQGNSITVDGFNNTYVTGIFNGSATFGQGEAQQTTLNDSGNGDIFIAKYDFVGALLWVKSAGGTGLDQGNAVAVDGNGNSYVTGQFLSSATFGAGEPNQTVLNSAGSSDVFIAKFNSNGLLQFVKGIGGLSTDQGFAIDVESSGTIYVGGTFRGTVIFGQGDPNQTTLIALGTSDAFHAKYNTSGSLIWARRSGGSGGTAIGTGITFDNSGYVYLTGFYSGTAIIGGGQATREVFTAGAGITDLFVAKYGPNQAKFVQRDFDGDGKADVGIYRDGAWSIVPSSGGAIISVAHGSPTFSPIPADFDGDHIADVSVYQDGVWSIRRSTLGGSIQVINLGAAGFTPVYADYENDGRVDAATYKDGVWVVRPSSGGSDFFEAHGGSAFLPFPADYDGDGFADFCVYHPTGVFSTVSDSDGGVITHLFPWGGPPFQAVPADYDGDGIVDVAVYHPDGVWSIVRSSDGVNVLVAWGGPNFIPVPGDYDGDGKADVAVYHPVGVFSILRSSDSGNTILAHGGNVADIPLR